MTTFYASSREERRQAEATQSPVVAELEGLFLSVPYQALLDAIVSERVRAFSPLGRPGYSLEALLRGLLASYYLNLRCTADLVRRLQEDPILALACGFDPRDIPHRTTFSRFKTKLAKRQAMIDQCLNSVTSELRSLLPEFGKHVAVDSTPVRSHCNPDREPISDSEGGWIVKGGHKKTGPGWQKDWRFGYRLHMVVDVNYELPIAKKQTRAEVQDVQALLPLLRETRERLPWFRPEAVIADKGYDSGDNHDGVVREFGANPIIPLKSRAKRPNVEITGSSAAPYCPAGFPLVYRNWDKNKGIQYVCPARAGRVECPIAHDCGLRTAWIRPVHDYRRFGHEVKRGTDEWAELYHKRGAVERVNSRLKLTRRLESHCFRGFDSINIHSTLAVLVMQAAALARVRDGRTDEVRGCVRQVG